MSRHEFIKEHKSGYEYRIIPHDVPPGMRKRMIERLEADPDGWKRCEASQVDGPEGTVAYYLSPAKASAALRRRIKRAAQRKEQAEGVVNEQ